MFYLFFALVISILANVAMALVLTHLHYKEKASLHEQLASKSLEEYKYFQKTFPVELEHNKKVLEKQREEPPPSKEDRFRTEVAKGY